MKNRVLPRGPRCGRGWPVRAAMVVAALAACLAPTVGTGPAFAALSTTAGPCGFHLGMPFETGALGSVGFEVPVYPADPHQVCHVTVTAQASLRPASGSYTNVANNPATTTLNFDFAGGPLPLGVVWVWSPHCADPAAPGTFTMTVDGQTSSLSQSPSSCSPDFGGHSSLTFNSIDPADTNIEVGLSATTSGHGYWAVSASGVVKARGDAVWAGNTPLPLPPTVGVTTDPTGHGYWVVAGNGGVFSFGGAAFHGSLGNVHLNAPIVGMASTGDGGGYWLVAADGGVFSFGNASFHGSLGNVHLNAPVVGMASTSNSGGYWLVAADGGVFSFGNAAFHGSLGNVHLNAPVVGMAATPSGGGYWLVAYDGGVFSFGDAAFKGSAGGASLAAPAFGMARTPSGQGYWLLGGDGGIFNFGDAGFHGAVPLEP